MMSKRRLKTVTRTQGNNRALKDGAVTLPDFVLDFEEVNPLPRAFRAMVREQAYDVCEMALTTYITARAYGVPITAIPVFLVRDFHHKSMVASAMASLPNLKDLEGRRVGVSRGYTVTTGVWARAILAEEHDVDLSNVTWSRSDDEHVPNWRMPSHVQDLNGEGSLDEQLARGDLDAAVGVVAGDATRSLIADPFAAGLAALKRRGFYPINHLVVVRDDLLAEVPDLAVQLFDAFSASKKAYVADLKAGRISDLTAADKTHLAVMDVMDDPLPYGFAPNADTLDSIMHHVVSQGIIDTAIPLEDLFATNTHGLVG
ncbi:MAG: ABC transporter substrate-binding protein [Tateyamaria sp.]|nr:ABC transporter substrate-binding protein [Tateyamaria sp.]